MSALIKEQIDIIRQRIAEAVRKSGRPASAVRMMAVTKTVDDRRIMQAMAAGVDMIGENYVQEARRKIELMGKSVEWHLIGHLQTNKAKDAVRLFDMIHSLDRIELARELDRRSGMAGLCGALGRASGSTTRLSGRTHGTWWTSGGTGRRVRCC